MRIAFVGKGGSGKTTLAALFIDHISRQSNTVVWAVDADLNIHLGSLLSFDHVPATKHLSCSKNQLILKEYVRGKSPRISSVNHLKKTTPPTAQSGFFRLSDPDNILFSKYSQQKKNTFLSTVGTYEKDEIGKSCYHNNLAILEIILSHTIDKDEIIAADMVAGVDAFAGTLHAQFDLLVLSVEPTKRSIEVYKQYAELAENAGVCDNLVVVGNKIETEHDKQFISQHIPSDKLIGFIEASSHIKHVDKGEEKLDPTKLGTESLVTLNLLYEFLKKNKKTFNERLQRIISLHKTYSSQEHIRSSLGDLMIQIDNDFDFDAFVRNG